MSEGLNKLKTIGAQKIHETTHISKQHVQAILYESFEDINKIQFVGFISILEREYNLELDDLKSKGLNYFLELTPEDSQVQTVFVTPKRNKSHTTAYIIITIAIFIAVTIFSLISSSSILKTQNIGLKELNNTAIESAKKIVIESNSSIEKDKPSQNNITKVEEVVIAPKKVEVKEEVKEEAKREIKLKDSSTSLIIKPKSKVWMGYIDIKTYKKHQTVFKKEFTFDTKKDWIIVFGHGYINLEIDGRIEKFSTKNNLRFLYKDGVLTKISLQEFKRLNRGKRW
ncbi:MAG: hypothetical protein U9P72_03570 [Campylobacterota bacterium]|nr:hypothetical protein [Campylobacterota bacterium]